MEEKEKNYIVVIVNNRRILHTLNYNWFKRKEDVKTYLRGLMLGMQLEGRKNLTAVAMLADDITDESEFTVIDERYHNMEIFFREFYWPRVNAMKALQTD